MCTTASSSSSLKFGIEQILSPHFGISSLCMMATAAAAAATTTTSAISPLSSTNSLAPSPNSSQSGMCSPSSISPSFVTNTSLSTVNPLNDNRTIFPAWVFCTRYSDRPSAGPRHRKSRKRESTGSSGSEEEKRPRTAFTSDQLDRLQQQFHDNRYLTEKRRQELAHELGLNESQIKIWFQNKRAKLKKASGDRTPMSFQMMTQLSQQSANAIRP